MKSLLGILSLLTLTSIVVFAADLFSGKWKGEIAAGPCSGFSVPGGGGGLPGGGGFPGGRGRGGPGFNLVPEASQRGGGFPGEPGTDRRGVQKVTLNIKAKEDK